jgi:hypothetical protein
LTIARNEPAHSKAVLRRRTVYCAKSIGKPARLNDNSFLITFTLSNIESSANSFNLLTAALVKVILPRKNIDADLA